MSEMNKTPILEIQDLEVIYKTDAEVVHAVNGISLTLNEGETIGLVGETGAGKTTTALSILSLLPDRTGIIKNGSIKFQGRELVGMKQREMDLIRGNLISMIFQDPMSSLNPVLRVGEQIAETIKLHNDNMDKKQVNDRVAEVLGLVGIPAERANEYPHQFSGGMKQRVMIAIALACKPILLIADEPTTALDVTIQSQILELINDLKRERQLSIIFITHDLGVVANMADRIAVMYAGKIVEYGTSEDIFYSSAHPYTWALLSSMPDLDTNEKLDAIPGTPPNMIYPPVGDAFAARNKYAMKIDFERQPPMFKISDTHYAATWLLHPDAPKVDPPKTILDRIARMKEKRGVENEQ